MFKASIQLMFIVNLNIICYKPMVHFGGSNFLTKTIVLIFLRFFFHTELFTVVRTFFN